jgi:hypothetical protein
MYGDFIAGFETATQLILRHLDDEPEDLRRYLEIIARTVEERKQMAIK